MRLSASLRLGLSLRRALVAWCTCALLAACGADQPTGPGGPNVLVILVDDLGFADAGSGAADAPSTPRIDELLAESARPRTYRTAPMCTPARAGLLTGVEPMKLGLLHNLSAREGGGLRAEATTLAERFRSAGWSTALVGKWHLGHARPESRPNAQGFERFRGFLGGWIEPTTRKRGAEADWWRDESPVDQLGYAPAMLLEEARRAILERPRDRPFFLWFSSPLPHAPLHAPPGAQLPPQLGEGPELNRAAMRSMVQELDRQVGVLLDLLASEGLARDTIVVFASDNGGDRELGADNGELRGGKYTPWDGGLRTRFALRLAGRVAAGERACDLSYLDLAPTLCALAGVPADPREFDGLDTSATWLRGEELAPRMLRYACERLDERRVAVVEDGRKLVRIVSKSGRKSTTLHDLRADPSESSELFPADDPRSARWLEAARELEGWR
jgi:arylsulfatase A-like enzyme